jgi:Family of unknown function (DUF6286)
VTTTPMSTDPISTAPMTTDPMSTAPMTTASTATPRRPASAPAAAPVAGLLVLLVLAAGAALIRDALVAWDVIGGTAWTTTPLQNLDVVQAQSWMVPAGVALALAGLALMIIALLPRKHPEVALGSSGNVWLRSGDLARLAQADATQIAGVVRVRAQASRSTVRVQVVTTAADPEPVQEAVTRSLTATFAPLDPAPAIRVRARTLGDS